MDCEQLTEIQYVPCTINLYCRNCIRLRGFHCFMSESLQNDVASVEDAKACLKHKASINDTPKPIHNQVTFQKISPYDREVALVESNSRPMDVALVNARQTNKMNDCTDIVELAKQVQKADEFVRANAGSKLNVIAEQIRHLQEQAKKVLTEAARDADLHHVACNLVKKPGTTYHLYSRHSGQKYLSLLSPQEWGSSCPHEFLGSYHLGLDMSWTPIEEMQRRTEENAVIDGILRANLALTN